MRIDEFMPRAEFAERHAVRVAAPPERAWRAVRELDVGRSMVIRTLFVLRSLPALLARREARGQRALGITMDGLLRGGFVLLAEEPPRELVLGLVGRFWKPAGGIVRVLPEEFAAFDRPGYAVAAWNFTILPAERGTLVATETRVRCTDEASRRSFRRYWRVVRPFSGWTRIAMLRSIRRAAEASHEGAPGTPAE